jgi:hypothetical protein
VFVIGSGLRFELDALTDDPSALARVPLFLGALFVVRFLPALLYRRPLGPGPTRVAGLLQATSLRFIVTAAEIGVAIDVVTPVTAAALISAGLLSVLVFPPIALAQGPPPGGGHDRPRAAGGRPPALTLLPNGEVPTG